MLTYEGLYIWLRASGARALCAHPSLLSQTSMHRGPACADAPFVAGSTRLRHDTLTLALGCASADVSGSSRI
jgi:hypothetical protein